MNLHSSLLQQQLQSKWELIHHLFILHHLMHLFSTSQADIKGKLQSWSLKKDKEECNGGFSSINWQVSEPSKRFQTTQFFTVVVTTMFKMKQLMFHQLTTKQVSLRCSQTEPLNGFYNLVERILFQQLMLKIVVMACQLTLQTDL